jgi:4-amino-4-deoxy-L-arabinose transferase-like glycosyltransferase
MAPGRPFLWLALAVVLIRAGVIGAMPAGLRGGDPDGYRALAENVWREGTFGREGRPTAYRPPLYPLLIAPVAAWGQGSFLALAALHVVLGAATVLLAADLGRRAGLGGAAWLAAVLVACDPILVKWSTEVMTETLAAFLAALALACLARVEGPGRLGWAAAAGTAMGLACLARPTFLAWLACVLPVLAWSVRPRRAAMAAAAVAGLASAVTLAPWTLRNVVQFGRPVVATTHGGYTLLLANNPEFYAYLRRPGDAGPWRAEAMEAHAAAARTHSPGGEWADDRALYDQAWRNIRQQPADFARAVAYRLSRLWGLLPQRVDAHEGWGQSWQRFATAGFYALEFLLALVGLWSLKGRLVVSPWPAVLALAASFTLVHALYWTDMRMRAPLVPAVALLAAAGWQRIARCRELPGPGEVPPNR